MIKHDQYSFPFEVLAVKHDQVQEKGEQVLQILIDAGNDPKISVARVLGVDANLYYKHGYVCYI